MAAFTIQQIDLSNRKQVKTFLDLPGIIYRNDPLWVPPLWRDAVRMLNTRENPFFKHSTAAFFLAFDSNDRPVARLACLDHRPFNTYNNQKTAFFYLFEAMDMPGVSVSLFEAAAAWARARGLNRIIGPRGFSTLDGIGLLSEGFEFRPALGIPYNPAYYVPMVEEAGFSMTGEILSGFMKPGFYRDPKIDLVAQKVQERWGLHIAQFHTRKDLRMLLPELERLYNDAIKGTTDNYPISAEEARTMANQILWFADPKLDQDRDERIPAGGFPFGLP